MARRTLNHKALCADFEAAERRKKETVGDGEGQTDEQEDEEEEGAETAEVEADAAAEEAPKKKKKPVKEPKPKRTRTPKVVRQRVVWVVYNNSNAKVQTFPYPQKHEADEYAKKMMADKGTTFFVQPVKEPIEEKKD